MKIDKVLWLAMVFSTFIYAVLVYITTGVPRDSFEAGLRNRYTVVCYGLAIMSFILGLIAPALMRGPQRVRMIVALAIFESCAIFGLLAAFLVRDWRLFVGPWIVALIGMWRAYPSSEYEQVPG